MPTQPEEQRAAMTEQRAAFEAWADDQGYPLRRLDIGDGSSYRDLRTDGAWEAWQAALSALPAGGGWKNIESAPKDGTAILLCWAINADGEPIDWREDLGTAGVFVQVASWWEGDNDWIVYCSMVRDPSLHFAPTHWMRLPDPPNALPAAPQQQENPK